MNAVVFFEYITYGHTDSVMLEKYHRTNLVHLIYQSYSSNTETVNAKLAIY